MATPPAASSSPSPSLPLPREGREWKGSDWSGGSAPLPSLLFFTDSRRRSKWEVDEQERRVRDSDERRPRFSSPMAGVGEWQQMRDTNWWRNGQREAGHQLGAPLAADFHGGDVVYLGACFFPTQRSPRAPMDGDGQHVRPRSRALLTDDEDDGTYANDVYSGNLAATGGSRAGRILGR